MDENIKNVEAHKACLGTDARNGEEEKKEQKIVKFPFRECFIYFIFLIFFTVMCMAGRTYGQHNFWISNQFRLNIDGDQFNDHNGQGRGFPDINVKADIENFIIQTLMPMLYINESDSGQPLEEDQYNVVFNQNKLVGGVRITLVRVNEEECGFTGLPSAFTPCYPEYFKNEVNKTDYHVGSLVMPYMSESQAHSAIFVAMINRNGYFGDGNVYDLSTVKSTAFAEVHELFTNDFIRRDARVIFFDFVTLNANLNLHTVVRLCFELPAEGGVVTYSEIKTWRFWRYLGSRGNLLFFMEIFVVIMVIFYTQEELLELYRQGFLEYKKCWWNIIDWLNLIFFYLTIFWRIKVEFSHKPNFTSLDEYESYRRYVRVFTMESYFNMVNGFLLTFKLFKYLNASARIRLLFTLFHKTAGDIIIFGIILFVILLSYGVTGFLVFSSDVSDYRTLSHSILNLIRYTVSDMDYAALQKSNIFVGTIYYVSWTVLMILVLVNVFIAILSDGYSEAQEDIKEEHENTFELLGKGNPLMNLFSSKFFDFLDKDRDGRVSHAELALEIGHEQARELISAYDRDGDGMLDKAEHEKMYEIETTDRRK